ncbi:V [Bat mastadenovirus WIV13]|uniref:V n=1 Tax=Bat mastadenovirus WIV13 TaxID=1788435 RepID=A0A1B0UHX5_9ADEN|nr:V [Bat mastadenovirus WIV13] [Bat mastadenovirus WIV13]AMB43028.1 V [Bat mastadenovirus WIV13] [Bat mastadenovirus WIV13]
MTSRQLKEEPYQPSVTEVHELPRNKRKRAYKDEKDEPIIKEIKKEFKINIPPQPKRQYRWRGRKVQKILRPGTALVYSSVPKLNRKRNAEEIFTDTDILEQAKNREGEFAYGKMPLLEMVTPNLKRKRGFSEEITDDFITTQLKKQKIEQLQKNLKRKKESNEYLNKKRKIEDSFVALDNYNPTPNLEPVTEQQIIPINRKRGREHLQPTGQLLTCKKRKTSQRADRCEANMEVALPIETSTGSELVKADIKVRPVKPVAPGLGIRTVDVDIPVNNTSDNVISESLQSTLVAPIQDKNRKKMIPEVKYHPSITVTTKKKKYPSANSIIPEAVYHPSIKHPRAKKRIIPEVRYHPSITIQRRNTI